MTKKTEKKVEIDIGMMVRITKPVSKNDTNDKCVGLVSDVIKKIGMSESLWGLDIRNSDGLHWYWEREFELVAEVGLLEEIDADLENMARNGIDSFLHEIVGSMIDDIQDVHPGVTRYTRLKQHGMETVDYVLQNFIEQMLDRI